MIDPFDAHPDHPVSKEKCNNILTLEQIRDIINIQIEKVDAYPSKTWGFNREDIIECLYETLDQITNAANAKE